MASSVLCSAGWKTSTWQGFYKWKSGSNLLQNFALWDPKCHASSFPILCENFQYTELQSDKSTCPDLKRLIHNSKYWSIWKKFIHALIYYSPYTFLDFPQNNIYKPLDLFILNLKHICLQKNLLVSEWSFLGLIGSEKAIKNIDNGFKFLSEVQR